MAGATHSPSSSDGTTTPGSGLFQVLVLAGGSGGDSSSSNVSGANQLVREYKKRRPHRKSRGGCLGCKQRRVKCDEGVPVCARCTRNHRECIYEGPDDDVSAAVPAAAQGARTKNAVDPALPRGGSSQSVAASGDDSRARASARTSASTTSTQQLVRAVKDQPPHAIATVPRSIRPQPFPQTGREIGTSSAELLSHVYTVDNNMLGLPDFMVPVIPAAVVVPHFRGTLLAVAALHLYHRAPGCRNHQRARRYQQAVALQGYQRALATPFAVQGQAGVDALLMTGMLMNALAFALPVDDVDASAASPSAPTADICPDPDPDPRRSWVFSKQPNHLGWLYLVVGMKALMTATAPWHKTSAMHLPSPGAENERTAFSGVWGPLHCVPDPWLELFGFERHALSQRPQQSEKPEQTVSGSSDSPVEEETVATSDGSDDSGGSDGPTEEVAVAAAEPDADADNAVNAAADTAADIKAKVEADEMDQLYWTPLRVIAELQYVPVMMQTVLVYFQFLSHISNAFVRKLEERDERAFWLYGMWVGLLSRHAGVWFVRRRARCDFRAIRLWLHRRGVAERPGKTGALWRQLLADLDATWGYDFAADAQMQELAGSQASPLAVEVV